MQAEASDMGSAQDLSQSASGARTSRGEPKIRALRNGDYTVTLSRQDIYKVVNALNEVAKKVEDHAATLAHVSPVWAIEVERDRALARRILNTAERV